MPRMIKLHDTHRGEIWLSVDKIEGIKNEAGTFVITQNYGFDVTETPEEVVAMIEQGEQNLVDAVKELTEAVRTFPAASEITKWKAEQYDSYKNAMKEPPKTIAKAGG